MLPLLYRDLVSWYRLVDPPADHLDEATSYQVALERGASMRPETLLDLGCGGGHNAMHLKRRFQCTLTDLSEPMLGLSLELNPECEHLQGDMRTLRLGRSFDVVLVHDAVMYMTTEADLLAAAHTAFEHTRPGGAALFAPDVFSDTFVTSTEHLSEDEGDRSLRGLIYSWDPDPADHTYRSEFRLRASRRENRSPPCTIPTSRGCSPGRRGHAFSRRPGFEPSLRRAPSTTARSTRSFSVTDPARESRAPSRPNHHHCGMMKFAGTMTITWRSSSTVTSSPTTSIWSVKTCT